jgi:hypothetical protein
VSASTTVPVSEPRGVFAAGGIEKSSTGAGSSPLTAPAK